MATTKGGERTRTRVRRHRPAQKDAPRFVVRKSGESRAQAHDPGPVAARARADSVGLGRASCLRLSSGGTVRVGTASWTDPTLTAPGVFYPEDARTPEARLRYYASRFSLVEVDSTYYAIPARRVTALWVERTPRDFVFDIKANALMTGHPTEVKRLPREIREMLPRKLTAAKRVYASHLPPEVVDAVWTMFVDALTPLREARKLGAVFLQYPRWFVPGPKSAEQIAEARHRLGDLPAAVEFRRRSWLSPKIRERTLSLLERNGMAYVMVDEPQGLPSSVPPVVAVTAPKLAVVRMHGRRAELWEKPAVPVSERFRYLYDRNQLDHWVPDIIDVAKQVQGVHVVMNNCHANYGTTNATEIAEMLIEADEERRRKE